MQEGFHSKWKKYVATGAAAFCLGLSFQSPILSSQTTANLIPVARDAALAPCKPANSFLESDAALEPSEVRTINLFRENTPSVVFISTFTERQDFFTLDMEEIPQGTGSGFVWDKQGHIVTNFHVIRSANSAQVALSDAKGKQTMYKATLTGIDPDNDIAVLKIEAPPAALRPIEVGTSSDLQVGQTALAIGNPFGLDHSLTIGVVSGLGRETKSPTGRPISNVIQTDAAINPGNSGGALLNSQGKLIGMNTAIYSPSGANSGVGFAIPVDTIKYVVKKLISDGSITRPIIGISFLDSEQTRGLGLPQGVLVLDVPKGSLAAKAGLRGTVRTFRGIEVGDIIVGLDSAEIKKEGDLFAALEPHKPGDVVELRVKRVSEDGNFVEKKLQVTLSASEVVVRRQ